MSARCVLKPKADHDIDGIADFLAEQAGMRTAVRFLRETFELLALLAEHPNLGAKCTLKHPGLRETRQLPVSRRFAKYLVFYRPGKDCIEVLRVLHSMQDLESLFFAEGVE